MKRYVTSLITVMVLFVTGPARGLSLDEIGVLVKAGQAEQAYSKIASSLHAISSSEEAFAFQFAMGRLSLHLGFMDRAKEHFAKIESGPFKSWSQFYLGVIARQSNDEKSAKGQLTSLAAGKQSLRLRTDARFELALTSLQEKNWSEARRHFLVLEKSFRDSSRYPEVLWHLLGAEKKSGRMWQACRWARKLYTRFPSHEQVAHWGIDLQNNDHDGQKLGCIATTGDQAKRIHRLQFGGQSQRARAEIDKLRERVASGTKTHIDLLFAQFLVREGQLKEAYNILSAMFASQKHSANYLNLLANVALRAGEYHAAVGAYDMIYKLSPGSKSGKQALFQGAFTSYVFRDYDNAIEKFQKFQSKFPSSGLSRDAAWNLAWMRYLRADYDGALDGFQRISNQQKGKKRAKSVPQDRIRYWMAMSLLKKGDTAQAIGIFEKLKAGQAESYYATLAGNRLSNIAKTEMRAPAENIGANDNNPFGETTETEAPAATAMNEEDESEENLAQMSEEKDDLDEVNDDAETAEGDDLFAKTDFSNPQMVESFERAKSFTKMGFDEAARWELHEIEKRTRKEDQLKALMAQYELIKCYNRSSYIGEVHFEKQMQRYGIDGVRYLWEHVYPQAFKETVEKNSQEFAIPSQLTWSIMRAESRFRVDAISPVGARGLMQLMPNTAGMVAQMIGFPFAEAKQLEVPETNIRLGSKYLARLMQKFDQNIPLVAAAYNGGPHRVDAWLSNLGYLGMDEFIEHIPFVETRNYVKKVVTNYIVYNDLYNKKKTAPTWLTETMSVRPKSSDYSKENWDAL